MAFSKPETIVYGIRGLRCHECYRGGEMLLRNSVRRRQFLQEKSRRWSCKIFDQRHLHCPLSYLLAVSLWLSDWEINGLTFAVMAAAILAPQCPTGAWARTGDHLFALDFLKACCRFSFSADGSAPDGGRHQWGEMFAIAGAISPVFPFTLDFKGGKGWQPPWAPFWRSPSGRY